MLEIKHTVWTIKWETKLYLNKFTIFIYERIIEREKGYEDESCEEINEGQWVRYVGGGS